MAQVLAPSAFSGWLERFLPGLAGGQPAALFTPAAVSDASDGQIAHLHGLNASRAWCWRRIGARLPAGDPRAAAAQAAAHRHARAALPHVAGSDYMVEHWLVAYAVLLLS
jgi:TctA family transporter